MRRNIVYGVRAGGMESSNVFNVALAFGCSILSGADLSADIVALAVGWENSDSSGLGDKTKARKKSRRNRNGDIRILFCKVIHEVAKD